MAGTLSAGDGGDQTLTFRFRIVGGQGRLLIFVYS